MNICVFDTETTSLDKPFCYNIGYAIVDTVSEMVLEKRDYVVEQIWHNLPLFSSAYYADKREIYVAAMRKRETVMDKFGYICRQMARDFKKYEISHAYAYNSAFDEKVFNFNCDWYKCNNPFDTIEIHDIRGYVIKNLVNDDYKNFCTTNGYFTDNDNYSTTAEVVYRYIKNDTEFIEDHTALSDALIETEILFACEEADITKDVPCPRSIERKVIKPFKVVKDGQTVYETDCSTIRFEKSKAIVRLKS